jgi:hypothetical protein
MPMYTVTIEYQGEKYNFLKWLNHEGLSDEEVREVILEDFYSTFGLVIEDENGKEV